MACDALSCPDAQDCHWDVGGVGFNGAVLRDGICDFHGEGVDVAEICEGAEGEVGEEGHLDEFEGEG